MNKITTITFRELSSYFLSPIAYVIMAVYIALYGVFFTGVFVTYGIANLQFSLFQCFTGISVYGPANDHAYPG